MRCKEFVSLFSNRERISYEVDAYISPLCHYCVDCEYTMARFSHEYLIENPTWPTELILHSVLIAWADYMYKEFRADFDHDYWSEAGQEALKTGHGGGDYFVV